MRSHQLTRSPISWTCTPPTPTSSWTWTCQPGSWTCCPSSSSIPPLVALTLWSVEREELLVRLNIAGHNWSPEQVIMYKSRGIIIGRTVSTISAEEGIMIIIKKEACQQSYVVPGERQKEGPSLTLKTVIAACRVHIVGAGI